MPSRAWRRAGKAALRVELVSGSAEEPPLEAPGFHAVSATLAMVRGAGFKVWRMGRYLDGPGLIIFAWNPQPANQDADR